jgi:hypothetical protein
VQELRDFWKINDLKTSSQIANHPKVQADMQIVMTNYMNTQYFASLFVGTPAQELIVIYDTGSDWLVIESNLCKTCLNNTYDHSSSSTFEFDGTVVEEHLYGSAQLYGYDVKDKVNLDLGGTTYASLFGFFEIHDQVGLVSNCTFLILFIE